MRRLVIAAAVLACGGLGGVGVPEVATATHQPGSSLCTGTGWRTNNTAYSNLSSQQTSNCRHKAAAKCGSTWYAAGSWKKMGDISSKSCNDVGLDITNNGWYTTLAH